jgi:uncharacterized delta-60 repeat protein
MKKLIPILLLLLIAVIFSFGGNCGGTEDSTDPTEEMGPDPGTPDTDFGTNGIVVHDNAAGGDGVDIGQSITPDSNGRILVVGWSENTVDQDMVIWRYNANGTLDTTFGGDVNPADGTPDGFIVYHNAAMGNFHDSGYSIIVDSNGKILVVGRSTGTLNDMTIWRYNSNGTLDTTFGGDVNPPDGIPDGFVFHNDTAGGNGDDWGSSIAIDANGKILVTGFSENTLDRDMVIWRYNANGTLDTTFGGDVNPVDGIPDGFVIHDNAAGGNLHDKGVSIHIDANGKILVSGNSRASSNDVTIWRFNSNGTLDTTFGGDVNPADGTPDGFFVHNDTAGGMNDDTGYSITTDTNGRIIVVGDAYNSAGNWDMVIWRLNTNGTLDTTFGGDVNPADGTPDGFVIHDNVAGGGGTDRGNSVAIDSSGRILISGTSLNNAADSDMIVWRFNADWTLDTTFDTDGIVIDDNVISGNDDQGTSITIDASGKILVTGSTSDGIDADMAIWRYNP